MKKGKNRQVFAKSPPMRILNTYLYYTAFTPISTTKVLLVDTTCQRRTELSFSCLLGIRKGVTKIM